MQSRFLSASLVVVTFVSVGLVGCTAPSIPDPDLQSESNQTSDPKKDAGSKKDGSTPTSPATPNEETKDAGPATASACGAETTAQACFTCCETAHPKALPFLDNAWGACACETPGACKADCATTFCGGKPPTQGDACDLCLTRIDAACITQAETACDANADCKGLFPCATEAKCDAKTK